MRQLVHNNRPGAPVISSWRPEVRTGSDPVWYPNALRFATQEEALANVLNLYSHWTSVTEFRVMPSDDPVNYRWVNGALEPINHTTGESE